jgi:sec-independent protein translocase protein TatA
MTTSWDFVSFISMPSGMEWVVIAIIGLLVFGKRVSEASRSLGRSIIEFKKGLRGIEDDDGTGGGRNDPSGPPLPPANLL